MEAASDEAEFESRVPGYIRDIAILGINARVAARVHLPPPHPFHAEMMEICEALGRLSDCGHHLWHTIETIEEAQDLTWVKRLDTVGMANRLDELAAASSAESKDRQLFADTSKLMRHWYLLGSTVEMLRRVNEKVRIIEARAKNAE